MLKRFLALLLAAAPIAAGAQALEPGEWEFTSTTSSPQLPKPQTGTFRNCIKRGEGANPERWMGKDARGDCKFTQNKKGPGVIAWEMECPKSSMRGRGTARIGQGTMESDMEISGDMQGRKFEMRTQMTGRRLGPCKS